MLFSFLFYLSYFVLIVVCLLLYRTSGPPRVKQTPRKQSAFRKQTVLPQTIDVESKVALVTGAAGFLALNIGKKNVCIVYSESQQLLI
jgi:hypothetical protein